MTKDAYLFSEFNPVSAKEWKQQIQMELKGADYNEALVWQSLEGISVKPFYHADDFEFIKIPELQEDYKIGQSIFIDDPEIANKIAIEAYLKGVDIIHFTADQSFDMDVLFQGFDALSRLPIVYIELQFLSINFAKELLDFSDKVKINLQIDPIGHLVKTGNWFYSQEKDFNALQDILKTKKQVLKIDASIYQNAGANIIQQIAYALSQATEYISVDENKEIINLQFEFAIGSNYFFEIAKLRAFRYLWKELMDEFNRQISIQIIAKPTRRNKTLYDYNVNMLRTSTEYMSAVLGGADVVFSHAYDQIFKKSNAFSQRIAKNQLLVLKEESGFKNAQDFAKGSYYIESLTLDFAKKSLQLYKDIEKQGGLLLGLTSGNIQRKITESAKKEQDLFDKGSITLLGTNKYPNKEDRIKNTLELFPFLKSNKQQTQIQAILPKRLSEKTEQERMQEE